MEAQELRQFNAQELETRIRQWREELFRARLKKMSNEMKDTSLFGKLRKDIARAMSVLSEKKKGGAVEDKPVAKKAQDKAPAKAESTEAAKG
ncbi:MAG: 50S ribosomal protein L29 [Bdellovibrionaceae bacterium]|nr:50S ribosomal protein L29 [Bdellovibrionales bacterium]MCB9253963.1 50S ribosomal protein L29 [Pseudobdellovibrionaceae bacterium]